MSSENHDLYNWCKHVKDENPSLQFDCEKLDRTYSEGTSDTLTSMLREELLKKNVDDLDEEIVEKRRLVVNLKNLLDNRNYLTEERQLQENKNIEKKVFNEMIGISILLVLSIFTNILLIYYFFVFRRK